LASIQRFKNKLTELERTEILTDSKNATKQGHWIWWGLPQPKPTDSTHPYSQNTLEYGMPDVTEAVLFLQDDILVDFYQQLLHNLSLKSNLLQYFGQVDYGKFKRHLDLFRKALGQLTGNKYSAISTSIAEIKKKIESSTHLLF
jgi:uncharacterized protein (DUF1810 family)